MVSKATLAKGKKLCKKYGVTYRFVPKGGNFAECWRNHIQVSKLNGDRQFMSALFHEIQHCINFRNKKYMDYHKGPISVKTWKRWALPAEIYTEVQAEKLAKANGFYEYIRFYYNDAKTKRWLKGFVNGK